LPRPSWWQRLFSFSLSYKPTAGVWFYIPLPVRMSPRECPFLFSARLCELSVDLWDVLNFQNSPILCTFANLDKKLWLCYIYIYVMKTIFLLQKIANKNCWKWNTQFRIFSRWAIVTPNDLWILLHCILLLY